MVGAKRDDAARESCQTLNGSFAGPGWVSDAESSLRERAVKEDDSANECDGSNAPSKRPGRLMEIPRADWLECRLNGDILTRMSGLSAANKVRAYAPGGIGNLGPALDVLG